MTVSAEASIRVDGKARARRTSRDERRAQIIEVATDVFGRQGYRQGSLKDVADEAGLTTPGLLHYFPTKEALLMDVLRHRATGRQEARNRVYEDSGLIAAGRFVLEENLERPGFMRLYVTLAAEATDPAHPAHDYFVERYDLTHRWFAERVAHDIEIGVLDPSTDADVLTSQLVAVMDGLQLQKLLRPELDVLAVYDVIFAHLAAESPGAP